MFKIETMRNFLITTIFALLLSFQTLIANSEWEVYNSYKTYTQLEEFHEMLYVRSGNAVFSTDPDAIFSGSFTQLEGLSSSDVQFLAKSEKADVLVFVHKDGVVDLMDAKGRISSIPELKNKSIVGNKTINNATVCGEKLFLACGFGYVEFDLKSQIIASYHFTARDCKFAFCYAGSTYYSLTDGGVWMCNAGKNISIESNWKQIEKKNLLDVAVFWHNGNEHCWIIDEGKQIHILNTDGSYKKNSTRYCYQQLKPSGNYVFSRGWGFDIIKIDNLEISYVQNGSIASCRDFYSASDSVLYAVHPNDGLIKLSVNFKNKSQAEIKQLEGGNNYFEIAGNQISELAYRDGVLGGISGYKMYTSGYNEMYVTNASVNYLKDGTWTHISESDVKASSLASKEFRGLTGITADTQNDNRFYVSTLTTGIYQFDGDSLTNHFFPNGRFTAVSSDEDGTLWAAEAFSDTAIWSYDPVGGQWTGHKNANFMQQSHIGRIFRQENEAHRIVWALNYYPYHKSRIALLYSEGNNSDQTAYISTLQDQDGNEYSLSSTISYIYDMQEDNNGQIWLLTNIGPFVVEDVVSTFNHAQKNAGIGLVKRIKVPRNDGTNLADYLLSTSSCSAMVTDSFNRKWIGTLSDGIYLLSSDGLREIEHFTTDNSPLHSDCITAFAYDREGKRLFIACEGGVVVLHTDDIEPAEDFSSFHCYPNPLRPDYFGDVEIVGLMQGSVVSITDVTGNLIWKTICYDNSVSWDGRNNDGERVAPGVYLIHGICEESSKGEICKLLVL